MHLAIGFLVGQSLQMHQKVLKFSNADVRWSARGKCAKRGLPCTQLCECDALCHVDKNNLRSTILSSILLQIISYVKIFCLFMLVEEQKYEELKTFFAIMRFAKPYHKSENKKSRKSGKRRTKSKIWKMRFLWKFVCNNLNFQTNIPKRNFSVKSRDLWN